jgi:eukaryotic-like serine/threonine-protein kinase
MMRPAVEEQATEPAQSEPRAQRGGAITQDSIGTVIEGRYQITGFIGSGGMGNVFEVEHLRLGRRFALKVLRPDLARDDKLVERFEREARALANLQSEHIVSIIDSGASSDGSPYFVMELLQGEDLRRLLSRLGPLPAKRAVHIGIDACRALHAAHAAGVVHRDLKPENLFIVKGDDGRDVVKLLDFGVAKLLTNDSTTPGAVIGTARYMAPEQGGLNAPLGPYTDIFALGVILYECLAGRVPFDGDTLERVLFKTVNHEPEPLHAIRPELPASLCETIQRALAKDPKARHVSAHGFAEALRLATGLPRDEREITAPLEITSASRPKRTMRWRGVLIAAAAVVVVGGSLALANSRARQVAPQAGVPAAVTGPELRSTPKPSATPQAAKPLESMPVTANAPAANPPRPVLMDSPSRAGTAVKAPRRARPMPASSSPRRDLPPISFDPENPYAREKPRVP